MTKFVFWQNALSIHQAPMIKALAEIQGVSVAVVAFEGISAARRLMGWTGADYGLSGLHRAHSRKETEKLALELLNADAHIFSGFGSYPGVADAYAALAAKAHPRLIVMSEPWDGRGVGGLIRMIRAYLRVRKWSRHIAGVLTCGSEARRQLQKFRIPSAVAMYDFGYFVDSCHSSGSHAPSRAAGGARIIFVGQLAEWKNPLALINALAQLTDLEWNLTIVGEGALRQEVSRLVQRRQLQHRVKVQTYLPNEEIRRAIASSDLLVLPSKYDGWGVVINEALMDGVRVVVSRAAGSSDLVVSQEVGSTVVPGDLVSLTDALRAELTKTDTADARAERGRWAEACISPRAAAAYLRSVVASLPDDVPAPWTVTLP